MSKDWNKEDRDVEVLLGVLDQDSEGQRVQESGGLVPESFDRIYRQCHSGDYKFGRVFKVLWSEPEVSAVTNMTIAKTVLARQYLNTRRFERNRRFIILDDKFGGCTCLGVFTHTQSGKMRTFRESYSKVRAHDIIKNTCLTLAQTACAAAMSRYGDSAGHHPYLLPEAIHHSDSFSHSQEGSIEVCNPIRRHHENQKLWS